MFWNLEMIRRCMSAAEPTTVAAERKQDYRGLASKIQCLARKITTVWLLRTNAQKDKSVQSTRILVEF